MGAPEPRKGRSVLVPAGEKSLVPDRSRRPAKSPDALQPPRLRQLPQDIRSFLVRALQQQSNGVANVRWVVRQLRKRSAHLYHDPLTPWAPEWRASLARPAMVHYLDPDGREVDYEGMAMGIGRHAYYCAIHRHTELMDATFARDKWHHTLRRHGGRHYYCPLCEVEAQSDDKVTLIR